MSPSEIIKMLEGQLHALEPDFCHVVIHDIHHIGRWKGHTLDSANTIARDVTYVGALRGAVPEAQQEARTEARGKALGLIKKVTVLFEVSGGTTVSWTVPRTQEDLRSDLFSSIPDKILRQIAAPELPPSHKRKSAA